MHVSMSVEVGILATALALVPRACMHQDAPIAGGVNNLSDKYSDNELLLTDDWFPVMASNVVEARTSLKMLKLLSFVI